jgi:hypothetical protein
MDGYSMVWVRLRSWTKGSNYIASMCASLQQKLRDPFPRIQKLVLHVNKHLVTMDRIVHMKTPDGKENTHS